jgi:uncharacterized membrane protein
MHSCRSGTGFPPDNFTPIRMDVSVLPDSMRALRYPGICIIITVSLALNRVRMKKRAHKILLFFNLILLAVSWVMAFYAYARLPAKMPLWLNFFGQEPIISDKSPAFFIYVVVQTLWFVAFIYVVWAKHRKNLSAQSPAVQSLQKEIVLLVSIFFQLIFIHLQRSLILLAHGVETGIRPYYFFSVIGIILILIPYYRMRLKALKSV